MSRGVFFFGLWGSADQTHVCAYIRRIHFFPNNNLNESINYHWCVFRPGRPSPKNWCTATLDARRHTAVTHPHHTGGFRRLGVDRAEALAGHPVPGVKREGLVLLVDNCLEYALPRRQLHRTLKRKTPGLSPILHPSGAVTQHASPLYLWGVDNVGSFRNLDKLGYLVFIGGYLVFSHVPRFLYYLLAFLY